MTPPPGMPALVLIPQGFEHDDALIVGSPAGLRVLRDAIDRALSTAAPVASDICDPGDGEGFAVTVLPTGERLTPWYVDDGRDQGGEWNGFYDRVLRSALESLARATDNGEGVDDNRG